MARVAIVTGSKSDVPALEPCLDTLKRLGIECELHVMSAHRSPAKVQQFAAGAAEAGFEVIIAAAGMAAHLPGVIAAWTPLPVIGIPLGPAGGTAVSGLDALLSIAQMPPGVPVACMAVNGAKNAALFAAAILALKDSAVRKSLERFRREQSAG